MDTLIDDPVERTASLPRPRLERAEAAVRILIERAGEAPNPTWL